MPVYEFSCQSSSCQHVGEVVSVQLPIEKRNDAPVCQCGITMDRVVSRGSFSLKGGGWASDGYSKKSRE